MPRPLLRVLLLAAGIYELVFSIYMLTWRGTEGLNHPRLAMAFAGALLVAGLWMVVMATKRWATAEAWLDRTFGQRDAA